MKPLINLKSFLAVLLVLIVSTALLVAYFRNYSTEGAGHEHSEKGTEGGVPMKINNGMSGMKSDDDTNATSEHGNMAMPQADAKPADEPAAKPAHETSRCVLPTTWAERAWRMLADGWNPWNPKCNDICPIE